jgi:hypothetical protein
MNINLAARPLTADETAALAKLPKATLVRMVAEDSPYDTEEQVKVWNRDTKARLLQVIALRFSKGRGVMVDEVTRTLGIPSIYT